MILDILLENEELLAEKCGAKKNGSKVNEGFDLDDLDDDDCGLHVEEPENDAIIVESLILESIGSGEEMDKFLNEEAHLYIKRGLLSEKSIVRLDKIAKLSRAESQAILAIAKERGDRDYKKYKTVYKMKKILFEKMEKKYYSEAKRRAKEMIKKSKSMAGSVANKLK